MKECWCIAGQPSAEYVHRMEDVLDLYQQPFDPMRPLVCFDETNTQLIEEARSPLSMAPGRPTRYDYEYIRHGVQNLFIFFAPLHNWREVKVTDTRTQVDWAYCMKDLVDLYFPNAQCIRVVMDNLSTHNPALLYNVFAPAEAKRILDRLEFHFTPKHGSWLNMAEIELSVLNRQCLDQYIPDRDTLAQQISAWTNRRNHEQATVIWRFTTDDARIRLKKLYPSIDG